MCLPNPAATPGTMWSPTGREESRPQRRSLFFRKPGAGLACFRQAFVRRLRCNAPTSLEAELRLRILPTAGRRKSWRIANTFRRQTEAPYCAPLAAPAKSVERTVAADIPETAPSAGCQECAAALGAIRKTARRIRSGAILTRRTRTAAVGHWL